MSDVTIDEAKAFVAAILEGRTTLACTADESPADIYAGDVPYVAAGGGFDGWRIVVFNDCDDFDYIDSITAPDGRGLDFEALWDAGFSRPAMTDEQVLRCFGIGASMGALL